MCRLLDACLIFYAAPFASSVFLEVETVAYIGGDISDKIASHGSETEASFHLPVSLFSSLSSKF